MLKTLFKFLFDLIPADSPLLYKVATKYADRFNCDNNSVFHNNGEAALLKREIHKFSEGVVFDIGANVGEWSKFCLSMAPNLNLHIFEPSTTTYKTLEKFKWPQNISLNNIGLGEKEENLSLNIFEDGSGLNSLYPRQGIGENQVIKTETVTIKTLDDYCERHEIQCIDYLKMDVEGHELSVLKGAKKMLQNKKINMIQFEYGGCNIDARVLLKDIWNFLNEHGYMISKIYPDNVKYFEKYDQRLENFKYSNWLATTAKS